MFDPAHASLTRKSTQDRFVSRCEDKISPVPKSSKTTEGHLADRAGVAAVALTKITAARERAFKAARRPHSFEVTTVQASGALDVRWGFGQTCGHSAYRSPRALGVTP